MSLRISTHGDLGTSINNNIELTNIFSHLEASSIFFVGGILKILTDIIKYGL